MPISNIQYIEYAVSAEDNEQQYGELSLENSHTDFMMALQVTSMSLNYKSISANETAITFATKKLHTLFVMQDAENSVLNTNVYLTEFNGFLAISEISHLLSLDAEKQLELKASLVHNNYKKFKLTIFPKIQFFEKIIIYKNGGYGKTLSDQQDYLLNFEY